jgi:hypothetical protein
VKPPAIIAIEPLGQQVYTVKVECLHPACLPEAFTVSLREKDWNGSCTCSTFADCCSFLLAKNPKKRSRCDHIVACRMWFMEREAPKLIEESESRIVVLPDYESPDISSTVLP